eukprot:3611199-Prymnesium_polylepis.1
MKYTQILALFANPSLTREQRKKGVRLPQLKLGQEMKVLLRAVPPVYLAIYPAATIKEAGTAVQIHRPNVVMFSGHTHRGGLAFETSEGTIELSETVTQAKNFVRMLREVRLNDDPEDVPSLECIFLNGASLFER